MIKKYLRINLISLSDECWTMASRRSNSNESSSVISADILSYSAEFFFLFMHLYLSRRCLFLLISFFFLYPSDISSSRLLLILYLVRNKQLFDSSRLVTNDKNRSISLPMSGITFDHIPIQISFLSNAFVICFRFASIETTTIIIIGQMNKEIVCPCVLKGSELCDRHA